MDSRVRDVMTTSVVAVRVTAGYKDIVTVMRQRHISAFPVLDAADHVIGVVSEADLLLKEIAPGPFTEPATSMLETGRRGERAKAAAVTAAELMNQPAITIGPDVSVAEAARLMYARRVKRLPVVNDDGRLLGVVSRVDVLSVFVRSDEQIRDEVIGKVIAGHFALDPNVFGVTVKSGIVTITGRAATRAVALDLLEAVRHVEGVVGMRDRVDYPPEEAPTAAGII